MSDTGEYRSPNRRHDRQFFYKYMTAKTARIVLSTRKLRWSSPLMFNDPFDIRQELRLSFDEAKLNAVIKDRWIALIEQGDPSNSVKNPMFATALRITLSLSPEERREMANDFRRETVTNTPGQIEALAELKNMWRWLVPCFRVMCLSEANDITPMWSIYAERHKGVVLEFSAVDQLDSIFLVARPVVYQDAPPLSHGLEHVRAYEAYTDNQEARFAFCPINLGPG